MKSLDLAIENGLPRNVEAEGAVLGAVLLDNETFPQIQGVLHAEDFSLEKHCRIFQSMEALYRRGDHIDAVMLGNELHRKGQLESVDGLSYLLELRDVLPSLAALDGCTRVVHEKATLRRGIFACQGLIDRCLSAQDNAQDILADAEKTFQDLLGWQAQSTKGLRGFAEIIEEFGGLNSYTQNHDPGLETPWPRLNAIIGGFRAGQMITIAGLTGSGKSAFGLQLAQHAARQGHGVTYFSLEMSGRELFERLACGNAGIDSKKLERNKLTEVERYDLQRASRELVELPLWIDDSTSSTVPGIHAALRKHRCHHEVKLLVLDYLQLVQPVGASRENRTQQVSEMSRAMKLMAREYKIPVIVLAQFNRGPAIERREPQLHDLRESGSIEQDSDKVLFLHPKEAAAGGPIEGPIPVNLIVAKQRNGKKRRWVELDFFDRYCRFEDSRKEATV